MKDRLGNTYTDYKQMRMPLFKAFLISTSIWGIGWTIIDAEDLTLKVFRVITAGFPLLALLGSIIAGIKTVRGDRRSLNGRE